MKIGGVSAGLMGRVEEYRCAGFQLPAVSVVGPSDLMGVLRDQEEVDNWPAELSAEDPVTISFVPLPWLPVCSPYTVLFFQICRGAGCSHFCNKDVADSAT